MKDSSEFFLRDYPDTPFPLRLNQLLVDKYSSQLRIFIQEIFLIWKGQFVFLELYRLYNHYLIRHQSEQGDHVA